MARLRISHPARLDLEHILVISAERWGELGAARYRALLSAALHATASAPDGPITRDRSRLLVRIRSLHVRHVRRDHGVRDPVHVIYYRVQRTIVEIVRVLHERMDPAHPFDAAARPRRGGRR